MIFALAHSGVCAAFCRETNERLCYLNVKDDEVVRSLFYNKNNETLITVSVYATDNFSTLKCRSTPLEFIRRGKPEDGGMALFEEESLQVRAHHALFAPRLDSKHHFKQKKKGGRTAQQWILIRNIG